MDEKTTKCAGIDWAKDYHALCVVDEAGRVLSEGRFAHEEGGITRLCQELVEMGVLRVAIERPEGILLERVLEAGIVVLAIRPNQLKASRPRFRATGARAKSDSLTPSASQSSPAPINTALGHWCPIRMRLRP